ncbi:MAG: metal resistance protein [Leptothrix sp. (in: Bacteria)]|nr:metal resistance protein [Leptothrix sp. (in: b-proteobacteria)]
MQSSVSHESHDAVAKRLRRAGGHLQNVITMLSDDRACLDVAQQLHAVERAIAAAKKQLIHDHIDHCLDHAIGEPAASARQALSEFKAITKYL